GQCLVPRRLHGGPGAGDHAAGQRGDRATPAWSGARVLPGLGRRQLPRCGACRWRGPDLQPAESTLPPGEEASLCVLVHNLGQNLDWNDDGLSKQNRGLFDAVLPADGEVTWRLQGAGDPSGESDLLRTLYNVGGLYGERHGWRSE